MNITRSRKPGHAPKSRATERERAEEALRESEGTLRAISASAQDAILMLNNDGNITFWNAAAEKMFRYSSEEALGKNLHILLAPPRFHEAHRIGFDHFRSTGEGAAVGKTLELAALRKDGTEFPIELSLSAVKLKDKWSAIGIVRDITERKRAEEALRRSEKDLKDAQHLARIGSWDWDARTDTITWSDEYYRIYGFDPAQRPPGYQEHLKAYTAESAARLDAAVNRNIQTGESYELELELARTEGPSRWIVARSETKRDAQGQVIGLRGTAQDITERKQAERERLAHLQFFESMNRVNRAILGANDLEQMMSDALNATFSIFDCDRAWLLFPCDPAAPSFRVPMEITKPEYPGAKVLNVDMPMSPGEAQSMREALESDAPVTYIAGTERSIATAKQFGVQSQMFVPIHPRSGKPWLLGVHQCSYPRLWTVEERILLQDIGRRLADALTSMLMQRDLRKSEERYRTVADFTYDWEDWVLPDGSLVYVSPACERIAGYGVQEFLNDPALRTRIVHADDRERVQAHFDSIHDISTSPDVEKLEFRIVTRLGQERWIAHVCQRVRGENGKYLGRRASNRDITERKQAENALNRVNRALKATSDCNMALIHASDELQLLGEICRIIVDAGGYRLAWVGYAEHDAQKTVRPVAHSGYEPGYMEHTNITWADDELGRGPVGIAIRSGQIQVVQDVMTDPRFEPWRANAAGLGYGSLLVAPLLIDSQAIGALSIYAEGADAFDAGEIALLSELAADMAFGIATLRARGAQEQSALRLQRSMEATIQVVAGTVEMRDPYTAGHQLRVAELATAIAHKMGLSEEQAHGIRLAGMVHDLGKVHVPAEILSKPGRLTRIEFQMIQAHPEAGYEILKDVDFPWPIAQMVYQHHERLDGSGYPRGLKADEILLEARILTVADVVEAMASHRPYRPALGIEPALQEIGAHAGKYYDADVVRACLALFREKAFAFKG